MLNDADRYQGGGNAGDEAWEKLNDAEALFGRLKRNVKADYNNKGQVNWRKEAREDFDFDAGEQLNEEDKAILQDAKPDRHFQPRRNNRRQRVRSGSRQLAGSAVLAAPARRREETRAADVGGEVGFASNTARRTRKAMPSATWLCAAWAGRKPEDNPEGDPKVDRTDPLEMTWDKGAKKRNLVGARRIAHIRRDVPIDEARALCPR